MPTSFTDVHRHRQNRAKYTYTVTYVVAGRDVTWQAQVDRGSKHWHLSGGGIQLPEEHAETGLGMTARQVVRLDLERAIDTLA